MHANVKVDHFSILEGEDLEMCAALRIVALLFVAFLFMNALKSLLEMRYVGAARRSAHPLATHASAAR